MAELSAMSDKFDAWAAEPPTDSIVSKKPPAGGRPPVGSKGGARGAGRQLGPLTGSARAGSHSKRLGLNQRENSVPRLVGEEEDEGAELTAEAMKLREIKAEMEQVDIDIIQNGGVNCGWDAADHKDFLRISTQMANRTGTVAFITAMAGAVPLADEASVKAHLEAHKTY